MNARALFFVVGVAVAGRCGVARAENEACFAAAVDGQKLRNAGKLMAARARLAACSRPACPAVVVQDCARWVTEVGDAIPSVVFGARDAAGRDVVDVKVFVDEAASATALDGRPVEIDPGPHRVRFVRDDGASFEQAIVARAGEKNRAVVAQFGEEPRAQPPPPPPSASPLPPPGPPRAADVPWGTWALGGVGVVALGVFTYFGARGLGDYNHFGCSTGCAPGDKHDVDSEFRAADVALVVGLAAIGGATLIYVTRPASGSGAVVGAGARF